MIAGWMNRQQQEIIEYLQAENSILIENLQEATRRYCPVGNYFCWHYGCTDLHLEIGSGEECRPVDRVDQLAVPIISGRRINTWMPFHPTYLPGKGPCRFRERQESFHRRLPARHKSA